MDASAALPEPADSAPDHRQSPTVRALVLLGLFAGGMPLAHTHSYLALVLASAGMCAYSVATEPRGRRFQAFKPWLLYGSLAAALSLPQLIAFTFVQATGSDHFLSVWFNWANNRGNRGLVDTYLWFYLKNVGVPYVLILLANLLRRCFSESPGGRSGCRTTCASTG